MPQLVKGGKHVFGWSGVSQEGVITIPEEAFKEYGFFKNEEVILIPGSKKSGGFGLSFLRLLQDSLIGKEIQNTLGSKDLASMQNELVPLKTRTIGISRIIDNRKVKLKESILEQFHIKKQNDLLVVRGSGFALGFLTKGPIYQEAKKYKDLLRY